MKHGMYRNRDKKRFALKWYKIGKVQFPSTYCDIEVLQLSFFAKRNSPFGEAVPLYF